MMVPSLNLQQPDRGSKRLCQDCGTRYYDLSRKPVLCPKCGVEHVEAVPLPSQGRRKPRGAGWGNATQEAGEAASPAVFDAASEQADREADEAEEAEDTDGEDDREAAEE